MPTPKPKKAPAKPPKAPPAAPAPPKKRKRKARGESKTSQRLIEANQKAADAMTLRIAGATYQQIADKLNYADPSGAQKAVERAMQRTIQEPADQLRQLELERLDKLWLGIYPKASQGEPVLVDRAIKIMDHRAKLLGLYAPVKQAATNPDGTPVDPQPSLFPPELIEQMARAVLTHPPAPAKVPPGGSPNDGG